MSRMLAAKNRARFAHPVFDKRMTHVGSHRFAAVFFDDFTHRSRTNQIVNDSRPPLFTERVHPPNFALGHHRRYSARSNGIS